MRRAWRVGPILFAVALIAAAALPAWAQGVGQFGVRPWGPHQFGPWMWAIGTLALLRALLVIGLLLLIWRLLGARTLWNRPDGATQLLRERYARGEISEDEYRKRLTTLS